MTDRERAMSAADFLNSGPKWRCGNCTADWPEYKQQGRWLIEKYGSEQWYVTHKQLIELAKAEGWEG